MMQDIFILSKVIDIFPKFKMASAAIFDIQFVWIWPFRRVDSVVIIIIIIILRMNVIATL